MYIYRHIYVLFVYIYIYRYIQYIYTSIYIRTITKGLGASKRQISQLVLTYGRFQGNLFEIVEIVKIIN